MTYTEPHIGLGFQQYSQTRKFEILPYRKVKDYTF